MFLTAISIRGSVCAACNGLSQLLCCERFHSIQQISKKGNYSGVKALRQLSQIHQDAILRENGYMVTTTGKHKKAITKEIYERVVRLGLMAQEAELHTEAPQCFRPEGIGLHRKIFDASRRQKTGYHAFTGRNNWPP